MVSVFFELIRHELQQLILHFPNIFPRGDPGAIGYAEYVCIHGDGRVTECGVEDHVCGFSPDPGQRFQSRTVFRYG